jgi:hypothetical protein
LDQITSTQIALIVGGLVYLLLCGGIGAYASTERGRSGMEGFWFGVALGPLGVIAAACMPSIVKVAQPTEEDEHDGAVRIALEQLALQRLNQKADLTSDEEFQLRLIEKLARRRV